ncbi:MAG: NAD(P)-dependent oxidoreductase, partial [Actinobacteria bacterium]|nr:NAD(P)-dependent oxidoreductase [Actinomycetota bacterium]
MTAAPLVVAVLGLGEAGSEIAADLRAAGAVVRAFDPVVPAAKLGVIECSGDADACRGAAVVLSLTTAHEAMDALKAALPGLSPGTVYADLNTSSSALKEALSSVADGAGVARFADVALMSPVPGKGLRTPMLASGPAAEDFARLIGGLGASVEVLAGPPGAAADRKLVRSVFFKGLAAAVTESLRAARAAGCADWIRESIAAELTGASEATIDRLEQGSVRHARRRAEEMAASAELLRSLGVPPRVAVASEEWLRQLLAEQDGL